jgi:hypothetical protein
METILEQDLQPVEDTQPTPDLPIDDLDLEEVIEGGDGKVDYQYVLTVKSEDEETDTQELEPSYIFLLTPKEEEGEEANNELEEIEDTSANIEATQAPQASVSPSPALPESVLTDLEPITENEAPISAAGGENTPAATATPPAPETPPTEPMPEEEPELEEASTEFSAEDLKSFIETSDMEIKFTIDEETEFSIDEAMDYLKLYPDTEVFVTIKGDLEEFKNKLEEFTSDKVEQQQTAETEEQNVMVDNEGETLDLKNTPTANPASPTAPRESFSIHNLKGHKNMTDGIYIGHIAENKLYGRIELKLTPDKIIVDKDVFSLNTPINITEAKGKENIDITLVATDVDKFLSLIKEKSDIVFDI